MAHFAKVENGKVTSVMVIANEAINNLEFPESESLGQQVIAESGFDGVWKQTSYSASFRGLFDGVGGIYDEAADEFTTLQVEQI